MTKGEKGKVKLIIINSIRILLVLAIFTSFYNDRKLILIMSIAGLGLTFLPFILQRLFKVSFPAQYEIIIILFIYGILFLGEVRGLYGEFIWWDVFLNMVSAIALGFIGLTILYALYKEEKINASPLIIAIFSFSFAVAFGALWEIFEFSLDQFFAINLLSPIDSLSDLFFDLAGGIIGTVYFLRKVG